MSDDQKHMRACLAALRQIRAHVLANDDQESFDSALFDVWMSKLEDGTGQDFSQFQIDDYQVPASDYLVTVSSVIAYLESMLGLDQAASAESAPTEARPIDADFTDVGEDPSPPASEPTRKERASLFQRLVK